MPSEALKKLYEQRTKTQSSVEKANAELKPLFENTLKALNKKIKELEEKEGASTEPAKDDSSSTEEKKERKKSGGRPAGAKNKPKGEKSSSSEPKKRGGRKAGSKNKPKAPTSTANTAKSTPKKKAAPAKKDEDLMTAAKEFGKKLGVTEDDCRKLTDMFDKARKKRKARVEKNAESGRTSAATGGNLTVVASLKEETSNIKSKVSTMQKANKSLTPVQLTTAGDQMKKMVMAIVKLAGNQKDARKFIMGIIKELEKELNKFEDGGEVDTEAIADGGDNIVGIQDGIKYGAGGVSKVKLAHYKGGLSDDDLDFEEGGAIDIMDLGEDGSMKDIQKWVWDDEVKGFDSGGSTDEARDKQIKAKPYGWRFRGKRTGRPTEADFADGRVRKAIYWKGELSGSDVDLRKKLEDGGEIEVFEISDDETLNWYKSGGATDIDLDRARKAKPYGWRFRGEGKNSRPTAKDLKDGRKHTYFKNDLSGSDKNMKTKV